MFDLTGRCGALLPEARHRLAIRQALYAQPYAARIWFSFRGGKRKEGKEDPWALGHRRHRSRQSA